MPSYRQSGRNRPQGKSNPEEPESRGKSPQTGRDDFEFALIDRATGGLVRFERRKRLARWGKRIAVTLLVLGSLAGIGYYAWNHFRQVPWTELPQFVKWDEFPSFREVESRSEP